MDNIQESINKYYDPIMKDINASARIVVEGKEEKTYITRIIDWEDQEITFHAPLVLGEYIRLLTETTYPFVMITKACVYTTSVNITNFTKNKQGHYYYKATINAPLKRNQQRRYFRLQWINTFKYKTQKSDGDSELWSDNWQEATTLDISAGGLLMASRDQVYRNDSIHIEIRLYDTDFILNGVVLESLGKNHTDLYIARVQFHELSRYSENLLSQAIMKRQRDMLG